MRISIANVAALLVLSAAPAAFAGQKIMASAPANNIYPTAQTMRCNIVNLNSTAKQVTVDAIDYSGIALETGGPYNLLPLQSISYLVSTPFAAYCRFTVDGNPKKYRAVATYDNGTSYTTINVAP